MIPQTTRTLPAQRIMAELARRFLRANIASAARIPGLHASNRYA